MKQRRKAGSGRTDRGAPQDVAAELAIAALTFIAEEPERLGRFLALSGLGPESLRRAAREPDFLLGVLDHIVGDEALLLAFAQHGGFDPIDVTRARDALTGESPQSS